MNNNHGDRCEVTAKRTVHHSSDPLPDSSGRACRRGDACSDGVCGNPAAVDGGEEVEEEPKPLLSLRWWLCRRWCWCLDFFSLAGGIAVIDAV